MRGLLLRGKGGEGREGREGKAEERGEGKEREGRGRNGLPRFKKKFWLQPCILGDWKIVLKNSINTCTTVGSDDVIVTSSKMPFLKKRENSEFIPPLLWPPNSPDLNPVDYSVWGILQEKVYKRCVTDLDVRSHGLHKNWVGSAGSRHHCSWCASVASSSLIMRQGRRRSLLFTFRFYSRKRRDSLLKNITNSFKSNFCVRPPPRWLRGWCKIGP